MKESFTKRQRDLIPFVQFLRQLPDRTRYLFLLMFFFLTFSMDAIAQRTVRGTVVDMNGESLPGVSVKLKGTNVGISTDVNGSFSISVPNEDAILVVNLLGFKSQEVQVVNQSTINVRLEELSTNLNEVIVTGYSTTAKKDLIGSVSTISVADLQKAPVLSFEQALGGRVAGVQVVSQDGKPGGANNIIIRGLGSITQSSSPLYVIDGLAIEDPDNNLIDPANIESMSVLKDASATAIYGARGSNGVIVITTKRGEKGPSRLNYNGYYGVSQPTKFFELLSPYEFVKLASDQFGAANNPYLTSNMTLEDYRNVKGTDWQDMLIRTGTMNNQSLSISGGGNNGTLYSLSSNYIKSQGIIIASDYTRYQGKITLDQKVGQKATVGGFLTYTNGKETGGSTSAGATSSLFFSAYTYRPISTPANAEIPLTDLLYDPDNTYPADYRLNPIISYENELRNNISKNILGNVYAKYDILKDLKLTLRGSLSSNNVIREAFNNSKTRSGGIYSPLGINGSVSNRTVNVYDNTNLLEYNKTFMQKHRLDLLAGTGLQKTDVQAFGYSAQNIPDETLGISGIDVGQVIAPNNIANVSENTLLSGFGSINYTYNNKYYFTSTFRADGSSKFAPKNRWGYFPSVGVKWKISEENFFKKLSFISDANIRLTYGETGNNRVGDFDYYSTLNFTTQLFLNGNLIGRNAVTSSLANPDLKWETTITKNLAFDLGFLDNRITLNVDFYDRDIKDLLYRTPLPGTTGYNTVIKNIATLNNRGVEISLGADVINKKNFTYSSNVNITFNRNRLGALSDPTEEGITTTINWEPNFSQIPAFISRIGGPLGQIYGLIFDGLYQYSDFDKIPNANGSVSYLLKPHLPTNAPTSTRASVQPGQQKFVDINGDGIISADDRTVIGNGYPKHFGGWSNNFRYKNLDLNLFLQWSYGNDIINANRIWFEGGEITYRRDFGPQQTFAAYANRWSPTNQNTDIAVIGANQNVYSTQYVEDGSFLRLQTFNLGYTFPSPLMTRLKITKLRAYLSASNLYTLTSYKGYDPEVSSYSSGLSPALDYSTYPRPFTITAGVNLTL